jgi:hypothetical protein
MILIFEFLISFSIALGVKCIPWMEKNPLLNYMHNVVPAPSRQGFCFPAAVTGTHQLAVNDTVILSPRRRFF